MNAGPLSDRPLSPDELEAEPDHLVVAPQRAVEQHDRGAGQALLQGVGHLRATGNVDKPLLIGAHLNAHRVARLAGKVQVMAVTHAPQVAARASHHLLISKDAMDKGKRVATRVNALAADHRREEIARMLAGAEITAEARAAAERLLKAAS